MTELAKPQAYEDHARELERQIREVRRKAALELLPTLMKEMRHRPHATQDEKKELVSWVNFELRRFGLAFKSPKTGGAASLVVDKGNHPEEGRFLLRSEGDSGKVEVFATPALSVLLSVLELTDAPVRQEGLANWAARAREAKRNSRAGVDGVL